MVDMLSQILSDKTQDVGKTSVLYWHLPNHHIVVLSPWLSDYF